MKKLVPFKKEIMFKSNLEEITSISLEHSLNIEADHLISGEFIISGDYRMNDNSINTEAFSFNIPFDIHMDEKYVLDKAVIDINDFYYEIINSKVLEVNIEVSLDKLEEKPLMEQAREIEVDLIDEPIVEHYFEEDRNVEERSNEEECIEEKQENINEGVYEMESKKEKIKKEEVKEDRCVEDEDIEVKSLFDNVTSEEEYATYKVCIVREGDSIESIMMRYSITKEQMELYNDLSDVKIGDKLIIPSVKS